MVKLASGEAPDCGRIGWPIVGSWHDEEVVEFLEDATTIDAIPNPGDGARTDALFLLTVLFLICGERCASSQHVIVIRWPNRRGEGYPFPIWRPCCFTD